MSTLSRHDPFEDLFRGFLVKPMGFANSGLPEQAIRVDVREQDKAYVVHAELPGVRKEDIHVTVDGNLVEIGAEVRQAKEVKDGERLLRSERYYGKLSRSFQLAQDVDDSESTAKFADGVLELTLPKKGGASTKSLKIL